MAMGWMTGLERTLVYFPDRSSAGPAAAVFPGGRDIRLRTEDGLELEAWLLPPTGPDRGMAVLYAPGNGGNRAGRVSLHRELVERGFTVLALEYRGYGGNPGTPTQDGLAADARAAVRFLADEGFTPQRTLYLGESLGTGVVAALAASHPPAGMLLRSPFTSLAAVGAVHYPWLPVDRLLRDRFPVVDHLRDGRVPVTVVRGEADGVVPSGLSAHVAVTARQAGTLVEEIVVPGADHNDPVMFGPQVADALARVADAAT